MIALLLASLLLGAADAAPAPAKRPGMRLAAAALQRGSTRSAIRIYEKQVEKEPDAPAPNVALGRAYAKAGRCGRALDQLWPWIGTVPFGHKAALAASTCSARLGLYADAIWFDRIALEEAPGNTSVLTAYALDLYAAGDPISAGEVVEVLATGLKGVKDRSRYVAAVEAARRGDYLELDFLRLLWEREHDVPGEAARLSAEVWLDLDDPGAALAMLGPRSRTVQLRPLRAEASRRLGDPEEAMWLLDMRIRGHAEGMYADAIRIRTLVDLGRLDDAAAVQAEWEGSDDPDLLASTWYLATALGDADAARAAAETYAIVQESPLRALPLLRPLDSRSP